MPAVLWAQGLQVLFVLACAPLVKGWMGRMKARFQSRIGPSVWQPYRDLYKLFHKQDLVPEDSTLVFRLAPYIYFAAPLVVTVLIPVLTNYPLVWAFAGDMLAGGFVLSLGAFFLVTAALDTGGPYSGIGSSRSRLVSYLAEPALIMMIFTVALTTASTTPYVVQRGLSSPPLLLTPAHVLAVLALLLVILAETGRIPVDNPDSQHELSMIDETRTFEFTGPRLALLRWGSEMKQLVLLLILVNVLVTPWGLAGGHELGQVLAAAAAVLAKVLVAASVIVLVEVTSAKIRLFRVPEFLGAAFVLALLAYVTYAARL